MRRGIQRGIGALKQQASPPQQQVQDAVARKSRGSLIDRLLGSPRPTQQPPLSEPLDIPLPAYNPPAEPPKAQVTRLSNGAHIAAEESEVRFTTQSIQRCLCPASCTDAPIRYGDSGGVCFCAELYPQLGHVHQHWLKGRAAI